MSSLCISEAIMIKSPLIDDKMECARTQQKYRINGRSKMLTKCLGVSEDDVLLADFIILLNPPQSQYRTSSSSKAERLLGYSSRRIQRSKALKLLGVSEEFIDEENSKMLASLGMGHRIKKKRYSSLMLRTGADQKYLYSQ